MTLCENCIHLFTGDGKCNDCLQPNLSTSWGMANFAPKDKDGLVMTSRPTGSERGLE